jgi:hypothetical protein
MNIDNTDSEHSNQKHKLKACEHSTNENRLPCQAWMDSAEELVYRAQKYLKSSHGTKALAYLHTHGFSDETIEECKLGYIPTGPDGRWLQQPLTKWGLPVIDPDKPHVTLFEGILSPWFVGKQIWKLEVQRFPTKSGEQPKAISIKGSLDALYNINALQPGRTVVLCESTFDAISGIQTCQNQAAFTTTGNMKLSQYPIWIEESLQQATQILVVIGSDIANTSNKPSIKPAAEFWHQHLTHAARAYAWDQSLNAMLQHNKNIAT